MDLLSLFLLNVNFAIIFLDIDMGLYLLTKADPMPSPAIYSTYDIVELIVFLGGRAVGATVVNLAAIYLGGMLGLPQGDLQFTLFLLCILAVTIIIRNNRAR
jgi:hypothetical protein